MGGGWVASSAMSTRLCRVFGLPSRCVALGGRSPGRCACAARLGESVHMHCVVDRLVTDDDVIAKDRCISKVDSLRVSCKLID